MTIEEMRKELEKIQAQIKEYSVAESFSDNEIEVINGLNEKFEGLKKTIETKEKIEAMNSKIENSTRKVVPNATKVEVNDNRPMSKALGFDSKGDFYTAVKNAGYGKIDKRFQNTHFEKVGEDGGFLVPDDIISTIQKKVEGDLSILPMTTSFPVSGNGLTLNIDENAPWSGGVTAYWVDEGGTHTESKQSFKQANFRLHKLGAFVKVTDELLEDATALESYISMLAPQAIIQKVNNAIINGDGVAKPNGLLNSGFTVSQAKDGSQTADTVTASNVINMYSRMLPASRGRAAWFINPAVEQQLRLAKDVANNYIYLSPGSQLNQTPYGMLMGRPVIPLMGSMPALGDLGDIIFADMRYYYTAIKTAGAKRAMSTHLYFDKDITAYKFIFRVDGKCPFTSAITTENGSYSMSGLVTLAARA